MNNGHYVDIDDQEYRAGPLTPRCRLCGMPEALCDCPPSWHEQPQGDSLLRWWAIIFAVVGMGVTGVGIVQALVDMGAF